ncbi:hypothetical protein PV325_010258 [Microctonus aethiopoides]|nr:hypothetical protein PV325_010258 [Microctonus aethiopoides]
MSNIVYSAEMNERNNNITEYIHSNDTSPLPSGASEILQFMGDSWLKDQSNEHNTSKDVSSIVFDNHCNANESHCEINHHITDATHESNKNAANERSEDIYSHFEKGHSNLMSGQDSNNNEPEDSMDKSNESKRDNSSQSEDGNLTYNVNHLENEFSIDQDNFENEYDLENNRNGSVNDQSDLQETDDRQNDGVGGESLSTDDEETNDPDYTPETSASINNSYQKSMISNKSVDVAYSGPPLDIRKLKVPYSRSDGKIPMKKDFCLYCKKLITKLPRHLKDKHVKEDKVKEFLRLPKGLPQKRQLINIIRREGNFLHNTDPKYNTGILITCRQQQAKCDKKADDYVTCSVCRGSFSKKTIRIHYKKCNVNHKKGSRGINILGRRLEGYIHHRACEILRKSIVPVMNDDQISRLIKYDELIIIMGNKFCEKYTHPHQHDLIRSNLRLLGRLKYALMQKDENLQELSSILHPERYDAVVTAVRECAGFDPKTQSFKSPSVASALGTLLKKSANRWISECIKRRDADKKKDAEEFLILFDDDFPTTINKKVVENQIKQKRVKKVILPLKKDIQLLYNYLHNVCESSMNILKQCFEISAWKALAEASLILLQMFNRRRAGEIERIEIEDFNNKESVDKQVNPDFYSKLSEKSREYAKKYVRITIRGKLGRTVPALLDNNLVNYIQTIIDNRKNAGVKSSNPYIFGIPTMNSHSKKYLRACNLMRKFSEKCGATMPQTLRGTTLRKHIATYIAMLGMEEHQISDLANFMGHNKQIHKDIYRVPVPMRDVTDVSQLLQAAIGGDEENENTDNSSDEEDDGINETNASCQLMPREKNRIISSDESDYNSENSEDFSTISRKNRSTSPFGKTKRRKWTDEEREIVFRNFGDATKLKKLPTLQKCQEVINANSGLQFRKPQQLKTWLDNQRKAESRKRVNNRKS